MQELCAGGALRDVVAHQMFRPREVGSLTTRGTRVGRQYLTLDADPARSAWHYTACVTVVTACVANGTSGPCGGVQVVYTYEDGLRWSIQIASALANLHAQRPLIIHRDLKLDNVLLTGDLQHGIAQLCMWLEHYTAGRPALCHAWSKCPWFGCHTGDCSAYDAKIADFGLHATVEQTDRSDSVKQL